MTYLLHKPLLVRLVAIVALVVGLVYAVSLDDGRELTGPPHSFKASQKEADRVQAARLATAPVAAYADDPARLVGAKADLISKAESLADEQRASYNNPALADKLDKLAQAGRELNTLGSAEERAKGISHITAVSDELLALIHPALPPLTDSNRYIGPPEG